MGNNIKIPIAISNLTGELVNAKDVLNGEECNCRCGGCDENLVAVNKGRIQSPHFRHKIDSSCSFNNKFESFIHWLTKSVFQEMNSITLPKIIAFDLNQENSIFNSLIDEAVALFKNNNLQIELHNITNLYSIVLQPDYLVSYKEIAIESPFKTNLGDVKIDIVICVGENYFFVEPFFTNEIDSVKLRKLKEIDVSTISIDLVSFVKRYRDAFTIDDFKSFLSEDLKSKKWIYIRKSKAEYLIDKKLKEINEIIVDFKSDSKINDEIDEFIDKQNQKISILYQEINKIQLQIEGKEKDRIKFPIEKLFN